MFSWKDVRRIVRQVEVPRGIDILMDVKQLREMLAFLQVYAIIVRKWNFWFLQNALSVIDVLDVFDLLPPTALIIERIGNLWRNLMNFFRPGSR